MLTQRNGGICLTGCMMCSWGIWTAGWRSFWWPRTAVNSSVDPQNSEFGPTIVGMMMGVTRQMRSSTLPLTRRLRPPFAGQAALDGASAPPTCHGTLGGTPHASCFSHTCVMLGLTSLAPKPPRSPVGEPVPDSSSPQSQQVCSA